MNSCLMWVTSAINWNISPCCFERGMLYCIPLPRENWTFGCSSLVTPVMLKAYHWLGSHPGWVKKAPALLWEACQFGTSPELKLWHVLPHFEKKRIWLKRKTNSIIYVFRRYWWLFSDTFFFAIWFTYFHGKFVPSIYVGVFLLDGFFLYKTKPQNNNYYFSYKVKECGFYMFSSLLPDTTGSHDGLSSQPFWTHNKTKLNIILRKLNK